MTASRRPALLIVHASALHLHGLHLALPPLCVIEGQFDSRSAVQVYDRGQQLAGQTVLGDEGIYQVQRLFWNAQSFGEQDDRCLRPEPSQFDGDLLPVHGRYEVVQNYNVNRMGGRQLQSLAAAGSGQNGVAKAFEEYPLALEHILVMVDTKNYAA
jgi:hypothetical protein